MKSSPAAPWSVRVSCRPRLHFGIGYGTVGCDASLLMSAGGRMHVLVPSPDGLVCAVWLLLVLCFAGGSNGSYGLPRG